MQHVDRVIKCGTVLQVVVKTSDNSESSHKRCRDDYDHLKNKNNIFFRLLSKGALNEAFLPERSNLEQTDTFLKIIVASTGVQTASYKRIHAGLPNQF